MMLAAFICLVIFPREITITALCILILADTAASLVGRRFGKIKIFDKSLEGSAAFFVTASLSVLLLSNLFPNSPHYLLAGLLAAFIATIIEAASTVLRLDDNFSVTMTVGIVMWLAQAVI
jgi:dolichol kinase